VKKRLCFLLVLAMCIGICSGCAKKPAPLDAPTISVTPAASQKVDQALNSFRLDAPTISVTPAASQKVDQALNSFSLKLLQTARDTQMEQTGILLSPLSAALALSMAANGADGDTLDEFQTLLGGEADLAELNAACVQLIKEYQNPGGSTKSSIANSLWTDPEGQISEEFTGTCKGVFDADVFQTDLSAPAIVSQLNGWVSDKTREMIPSLIDEPFSPDAAALLVNALYLENRFIHEFDPNSTRLRAFFHADESREDKTFMHESLISYPYIKGSGAQGVILPYDDGRLGFAAILPEGDLDSWLASLSGNDLSELFLSAQDTRFETLALPKFEFEWQGSLVDILTELGLENAFTAGVADFSRLGSHPDGYFLSDVIHTAKIAVKEEGTKAAAATAVIVAPGAAPPPENAVTLIFDHPFLYAIVDLQTGLPLFLGTFE